MSFDITDQEKADDIRRRFHLMALPIAGLIQECAKDGFIINFSINLKDGEPDIRCDISKVIKL